MMTKLGRQRGESTADALLLRLQERERAGVVPARGANDWWQERAIMLQGTWKTRRRHGGGSQPGGVRRAGLEVLYCRYTWRSRGIETLLTRRIIEAVAELEISQRTAGGAMSPGGREEERWLHAHVGRDWTCVSFV